MKCVYREAMGWLNPICENVGGIRRIIPNYPVRRDTYSHVLEIETDEFPFWCDTKYLFVKYGGYCKFHPHGDLSKEPKYNHLYNLKDGDLIDVRPREVYFNRQEHLSPITNDPRVLCIMHRAERELPQRLTEAQIKAFCAHIPTWDEATAYLKEIGALTTCVPEDEMYKNMKNEEK